MTTVSATDTLARDFILPTRRLEPSRGWSLRRLREIWVYRELLYFLIWRDIKVRYKQTALGAGWAILQPVMSMVVFTIFFGRLAKVPSDGIPYPVFSMAALVPWTYFSTALSTGSQSVVANQHVLAKVYFPRLLLPLASVLGPLVDFRIAFAVLVVLMLWYGIVARAPRCCGCRCSCCCRAHGDGGQHLAGRAQRPVPRRPVRRPVSDPALDVRVAGRLFLVDGAGEVAPRCTGSTRWPASFRASAGRWSAAPRRG